MRSESSKPRSRRRAPGDLNRILEFDEIARSPVDAAVQVHQPWIFGAPRRLGGLLLSPTRF
jgi:hypothetical protein